MSSIIQLIILYYVEWTERQNVLYPSTALEFRSLKSYNNRHVCWYVIHMPAFTREGNRYDGLEKVDGSKGGWK